LSITSYLVRTPELLILIIDLYTCSSSLPLLGAGMGAKLVCQAVVGMNAQVLRVFDFVSSAFPD
jgi:hypothetical protein